MARGQVCYGVLGRGEQILLRDFIPLEEYRRAADDFHPAADWADRVTDQAVRAGARYVILTTRHHDRYCLSDTSRDPLNAATTGPDRDLVGPDEKGYVTDRDRNALDRIGQWLERHGEAVYGTWPEGICRAVVSSLASLRGTLSHGK